MMMQLHGIVSALVIMVMVALMFGLCVAEAEVKQGKSNAVTGREHVRRVKLPTRRSRARRALTVEQKIDFLQIHNDLRKGEESSTMKRMIWSDKLEEMAKAWAEGCTFDHGQPTGIEMPYNPIGQNLAYTSKDTFTVQGVIDMWFTENINYNLVDNTCTANEECGHYTQVVWDKSFELGCWMEKCTDLLNSEGASLGENEFIVCNYGPAGNIIDQRPYVKGAACTACPDLHYACDKKLCSNKKLADCSNCTCEAPCANGGNKNQECTCDCKDGWTGSLCSEECVDIDSTCKDNTWEECEGESSGEGKGEGEGNTEDGTGKSVAEACPALCCMCVPKDGETDECYEARQTTSEPTSTPAGDNGSTRFLPGSLLILATSLALSMTIMI